MRLRHFPAAAAPFRCGFSCALLLLSGLHFHMSATHMNIRPNRKTTQGIEEESAEQSKPKEEKNATMSMAVSSSLRALAPVPSRLPSARQSGVAAPASRAGYRRRRGAGLAALPSDAQWLERLPEKKKPLYTHSLPCIEAWLRSIGFAQTREDPAVWVAEMPLWHARLSLDVTDLHIRYLKSGPGNLEKDVERRFSYALSREDIENAILGGP